MATLTMKTSQEMTEMIEKMEDFRLLDIWDSLQKYPDMSEKYGSYSTWTMQDWAEAIHTEKERRGL